MVCMLFTCMILVWYAHIICDVFVSSFLRFLVSFSVVSLFPRFFVSSFLRFLVSSFLRFFVSSFLRFFVSSFLRFFVSLFPRFFISSFLRFLVPTGGLQVPGWRCSFRVFFNGFGIFFLILLIFFFDPLNIFFLILLIFFFLIPIPAIRCTYIKILKAYACSMFQSCAIVRTLGPVFGWPFKNGVWANHGSTHEKVTRKLNQSEFRHETSLRASKTVEVSSRVTWENSKVHAQSQRERKTF